VPLGVKGRLMQVLVPVSLKPPLISSGANPLLIKYWVGFWLVMYRKASFPRSRNAPFDNQIKFVSIFINKLLEKSLEPVAYVNPAN